MHQMHLCMVVAIILAPCKTFLNFPCVYMTLKMFKHFSNGILNKSWPLYSGKKAGKQVKMGEISRSYPIQVVQSRGIKLFSTTQSCGDPNNCIAIQRTFLQNAIVNRKHQFKHSHEANLSLSSEM